MPQPGEGAATEQEEQGADPDRGRGAEPAGAAEVAEGVGHVDDGLALGDGDLEAAQQGECAEGDDEAVEAQFEDEEAVDRADERADQQAQWDGGPSGEQSEAVEAGAVVGQDEPDGDHRGDADGGFQGEVHPAGDQDERLGEDEQAQLGGLLADAEEVVGGEEGGRDDEADDAQDEQDRDE